MNRSVSTIALLLLASDVLLYAQPQPATPHTPDLLGIYPGMTDRAARIQLQKQSSSIAVQASASDSGLSLTINERNADQIQVYMTQAPNDPPTVWRIARTQSSGGAAGTPLSQTVVLTALREKYGKETLNSDRGPGGLYLYWIFDASGKLLACADAVLQDCDGGNFITYMSSGPPRQLTDTQKACYSSFFAVRAFFNRRDSQFLNAYTVELVNLPYAYKAAMNTVNATNVAAQKAR